jgi:hypothetical protein
MDKNNDNQVADKVMDEIKTGKIKLRSRFVFLLEKFGVGGAIAIFALISALFFSLVFFYMFATDHLQYLSFGSRGIYAFLESFPYLLVISFIVIMAIAGFILKRSGFLYQKPFGWLALGLLVLIIILGTGLAFTSLAEKIERHTFENRRGAIFMHPFLDQGLERRGHGIAGKISGIDGTTITISTPRGTEIIDVSKVENKKLIALEIDNFITAVGAREKEIFKALDLRIEDELHMPMQRRGIERRFPGIPPQSAPCQERECPFHQQ